MMKSGELLNGVNFAGKLESAELPEGLLRIEACTFMDCKHLRHITIPPSVQYIGRNAFSGCTALQEVTFPKGLQMIDRGAFAASGLQHVRLSGVTLIAEGAFEGCADLCSISIDAKYIGKRSFARCERLRDIHLRAGLLTVGEEAFRDCFALDDVCIPDGTCELGNLAFAGIPGLSAHLPGELKEYVENYRTFRATFGKEQNYIFESTAKIFYNAGVTDCAHI